MHLGPNSTSWAITSNYTPPPPPITTNSGQSVQGNSSSISLDLILIVTTIVFLILATMLFLVQRTLLKIASTSGVDIESKSKKSLPPLWKTIVKNQFFIIYKKLILD